MATRILKKDYEALCKKLGAFEYVTIAKRSKDSPCRIEFDNGTIFQKDGAVIAVKTGGRIYVNEDYVAELADNLPENVSAKNAQRQALKVAIRKLAKVFLVDRQWSPITGEDEETAGILTWGPEWEGFGTVFED